MTNAAVLDLPGVGNLQLNPSLFDFRLLLFDDNVRWLETTREHLEERGIGRVDIAKSAAEASERVVGEHYDAILADILLSDNPGRDDYQGDDWLLEHRQRIRHAYKAVVTGFPERIKDIKELNRADVEVVRKGREEERVYSKLATLSRDKRERVEGKLRQLIPILVRSLSESSLDFLVDDPVRLANIEKEVRGEVAHVFLDWVGQRDDRETEGFWVGDRRVSLVEACLEVENHTELGNRLMLLFGRYLRRLIGLRGEVVEGNVRERE